MPVKKVKKSNATIDTQIHTLYTTYSKLYNIVLTPTRSSTTSAFRTLLPDSKLLFGKTKVLSKALSKVCKNTKLLKNVNALLFTARDAEQIRNLDVYDYYKANDIVDEMSISSVEKEVEGYTELVDGRWVLKKVIRYAKGEKISVEDAGILRKAGMKLMKLDIKVLESIETNKE